MFLTSSSVSSFSLFPYLHPSLPPTTSFLLFFSPFPFPPSSLSSPLSLSSSHAHTPFEPPSLNMCRMHFTLSASRRVSVEGASLTSWFNRPVLLMPLVSRSLALISLNRLILLNCYVVWVCIGVVYIVFRGYILLDTDCSVLAISCEELWVVFIFICDHIRDIDILFDFPTRELTVLFSDALCNKTCDYYPVSSRPQPKPGCHTHL